MATPKIDFIEDMAHKLSRYQDDFIKWLEKERDIAKEISGNFELSDDVRKKYHIRHEVLVEIRHRFVVGA